MATSPKKPAINRTFPPDRAAWEAAVETLEILTGRRGDKITVPALTTLTFSSPPTQAECQALYQYTNRVRDALEKVIVRLDT